MTSPVGVPACTNESGPGGGWTGAFCAANDAVPLDAAHRPSTIVAAAIKSCERRGRFDVQCLEVVSKPAGGSCPRWFDRLIIRPELVEGRTAPLGARADKHLSRGTALRANRGGPVRGQALQVLKPLELCAERLLMSASPGSAAAEGPRSPCAPEHSTRETGQRSRQCISTAHEPRP